LDWNGVGEAGCINSGNTEHAIIIREAGGGCKGLSVRFDWRLRELAIVVAHVDARLDNWDERCLVLFIDNGFPIDTCEPRMILDVIDALNRQRVLTLVPSLNFGSFINSPSKSERQSSETFASILNGLYLMLSNISCWFSELKGGAPVSIS